MRGFLRRRRKRRVYYSFGYSFKSKKLARKHKKLTKRFMDEGVW